MTQTKKGIPWSSRLGVGRGAHNPTCKTWTCLETSTEASEEEEGSGGHGPKTGRSAIEEEEEEAHVPYYE
jgi:hypothetical protein